MVTPTGDIVIVAPAIGFGDCVLEVDALLLVVADVIVAGLLSLSL